MRDHALSALVVQQLARHEQRHFADPASWQRHLQQLGLGDLQVTPDPVRVATEGALWGAVAAHGFLGEAVIVSDDAGQFNVGEHALCWIHAERLVPKLETFTDRHRAAQQHVRGLIWWFYADRKAYRADPTPRRRRELRTRFDRIFQRTTGFATLDRLLQRLHANKAELLRVLDRPDIPLHTNGSENDIRCQVTKRQVSGGTKTDTGRDCQDAFLGLAKTCAKLRVSFWDYLGNRIGIPAPQSYRGSPTSSEAKPSSPDRPPTRGFAPVTCEECKSLISGGIPHFGPRATGYGPASSRANAFCWISVSRVR